MPFTPNDNLEHWHDWFAWYPVRTEDGEWLWLEPVRRRIEHFRGGEDYYYERSGP